MASITFRLRSSSHVGAVNLDGKVISVRELQTAIAEKLKAPQEEIKIFMADSTDELHPNEELLAYSVVDVVRQSHTGRLTYANSRAAASRSDPSSLYGNSADASALPSGGGGGIHMANLTEEERLAQLQAEVTLDTGIDQASGLRYRRGGGMGGRGMGGRGRGGGYGGRDGTAEGMGGGFNPMDVDNFRPPPKGYICHNCGKAGHYIQHCPAIKANGGKHIRLLSLPIGIPESMLVECTMDDPAPKFITRDHRLVKRKMDASAFATVVLPTMAGAESPLPQPLADSTSDPSKALHDTEKKERAGHEGGSGDDERTADVVRDGAVAAEPAKEAGASDFPEEYLCIMDRVPAKEALKTPCCDRLICKSCFDALVAKVMRLMEDMDADPPQCPACEEPLMIDEFKPAEAERKKIAALLTSRKRTRA